MTSARDDVLARVRDALRDGPASVAVPRAYETSLPAGTDLVELFAERVADYRASVLWATDAGLADTIAAALEAQGARRVAAPPGLPDGWLSAASAASVEPVGDDPPLSIATLDRLDGVLTGCAVAIAETGTIVLDSGPAQGRRVLSLLPDYHLCVVEADRIVGTVPEALARLDPNRPLTWISGPSATSDIELQRVEGVHGPRTLDVIIVSRPPG
jgi:L-lactate dehydrogenase complex protein LldG